MSVRFQKLLGAALFGASFFCAAPSMAIVATTTCNDISGNGVTITECSDGSTGSYRLVNNTESLISQFYVSTKATAPNQDSWTTRTDNAGGDWGSYYVSKDGWGEKPYGSFESLFGTVDTGVFYYFSLGESPYHIAANEETDYEFFFGASAESEFIAINENGNIIARSFNAPASDVPEPGSLALLGLGIAGLSVVRRKRQTK
jgi:hypothetical protein